MSKAGLLGDHIKEKIDITGTFWDEMYMESLKKAIELTYATDVIKTHGVADIVIRPEVGNQSQKVLVKWYRRMNPLTDDYLKEKYGRDVNQEDHEDLIEFLSEENLEKLAEEKFGNTKSLHGTAGAAMGGFINCGNMIREKLQMQRNQEENVEE